MAALQANLDLEASLVEGHNGIYRVDVDSAVVYTNHGECAQGFLTEPEMVEIVARHLGQEFTASEAPSEMDHGDGPTAVFRS